MIYNNNMNALHVSIGAKIEDWILNSEESLEQDTLFYLKRESKDDCITLDKLYVISMHNLYCFIVNENIFNKEEQEYIQEKKELKFLLGDRRDNV